MDIKYITHSFIVIVALVLSGCAQASKQAPKQTPMDSKPLKDSIAITTFMDFRLGSSRKEVMSLIDSLTNAQQIYHFETIENEYSDKAHRYYDVAAIDRMEERHNFVGHIIAKGEDGLYDKYRTEVELQFYQDSLYSVLVYPSYVPNEEMYNILTDRYSEYYDSKVHKSTSIYDYYSLDESRSIISKDTSYDAKSRMWEFKTSTIGIATLTTHYTEWTFDKNSFWYVIEDSPWRYDYDFDKRKEHWVAESLLSNALVQYIRHNSKDKVYFWYRNDFIQAQLDSIKAEKAERQRQLKIEEEKKKEDESNRLKDEFGKQTF